MDGRLEPVIEGAEELGSSTAWLNRNVAGMCLASLFSDLGHEMATAILPLFIAAIGASPAALGFIEGASDGASTFAKVGVAGSPITLACARKSQASAI